MSGQGAKPNPLTLRAEDLSLATDLYQLTMAAAYESLEPMPRASFELFVRRLPRGRNFMVFAGLEQALGALLALRFSPHQLDYLRSLAPFREVPETFFDHLAGFHFGGDVWAMPEGTVFFAGEPVLRVTGTLFEAQLVETLLLSIINFQTAIASKAARIRLAAGDGVSLAEFGSRRAHGLQAGVWAARAACLGGFDATSNLLAGQQTGIPVVGTMAHSYVMAFESETEAFQHYQKLFPEHSILLVDTYDTLEGVRHALETGRPFNGVRLDSGNLVELSRQARRLLDDNGHRDAKIFASGDMDEWRLRELRAADAPIDAFGVGTRLVTSADSPYVGGIYKLIEIEVDGRPEPRFKDSEGKVTYPGRKQVVRQLDRETMVRDLICPDTGEDGGSGLLRPVIDRGEVVKWTDLAEARRHCREELARLPQRLRRLETEVEPYPVLVDRKLEELLARQRAGVT